jgi:ribulose-phosphate 3-epimerase
MAIRIAPSILSANFKNLQKDVKAAEEGEADIIHCDIMDGNFVPNISFGPSIVKMVDEMTGLPLDVHLMIENPDKYIGRFVRSGADMISVHAENCPHLHRTIWHIKDLGAKAGVVLNPATPLDWIKYVLTDLDYVLIMTVNPGFGGQSFISSVLPKISKLKELINEVGFDCLVEVDGGIDTETAPQVAEAGADILVAGSFIFGSGNIQKAIFDLRQSASKVIYV